LKSNIAADIERLNHSELRDVDIGVAIDYYMTHIGYQIALSTAGNQKIDFDGKPVGKVTEQEAMYARQKAAEIKKSMEQQRQQGPLPRFVTEPARPPMMIHQFDEARSSLTLPELLTKLQGRLPRLATLIDSPDDEFRERFLRAVLDEMRTDVVHMIAKLNKPATGA
jgi:hypothetical protein